MKAVKGILVVGVGLSLVGCGGGGNDGGGAGGNSGEVPAPSVKLTKQNAENVAKILVSGEGSVMDSGPANIFRSVQLDSANKLSVKYVSEVVSKHAKAAGTTSLVRSTRAVETVSCPGGGTMTISGAEANSTIAYANCSSSGVTMNGNVSTTYSGSGDIDLYQDDYQDSMTITYNNLQVVDNVSGGSSSMSGSIQFDETYTAADQRTVGTLTVPSFSMTVGSESFNMYNTTSEWTEDFTMSSWNDNGVFDDSILGAFSFEAITTFEQYYGSYPHAGKVKLVGLNSSLVMSAADLSVTFELDSNGDDAIDDTWTVAPSTLGFSLYY